MISKPLPIATLCRLACLAILVAGSAASAQQISRLAATLPDVPRPQEQVHPEQQQDPPDPETTGTLGGTVLDTNGGPVQGATVTLNAVHGASGVRQTTSGSTGQFEFKGIAPGIYSVSISGAGMQTFVSPSVTVAAQEVKTVPNVVLSVARATTSVTVLDSTAASIEQEHIAMQQRVFGVLPNFYSSYQWDAPPLMNKQKYGLATRTLIDPVSFIVVAGIAGAEQYKNVFPTFGGGIEGYGKRYGAAYASHASGELLTRAVFPSIFHQDPRYFVKGTGSGKSRALHAVLSTFVTRRDGGGSAPNYSEIFGDLTAGALTEAYYPAGERGVHLFLINGFGNIAGDAVDNVIREFILNRITTRASNKQSKP